MCKETDFQDGWLFVQVSAILSLSEPKPCVWISWNKILSDETFVCFLCACDCIYCLFVFLYLCYPSPSLFRPCWCFTPHSSCSENERDRLCASLNKIRKNYTKYKQGEFIYQYLLKVMPQPGCTLITETSKSQRWWILFSILRMKMYILSYFRKKKIIIISED